MFLSREEKYHNYFHLKMVNITFSIPASVILTVLGSDDVRPYYRAPGWTRENPNIKMTRPETDEVGWTLYSLTAFDPKTSELISRFEKIDGTDPNGFFKIEGSE